jgi:hypothetical protein
MMDRQKLDAINKTITSMRCALGFLRPLLPMQDKELSLTFPGQDIYSQICFVTGQLEGLALRCADIRDKGDIS